MTIRPIRSKADYEEALSAVEHLWGARSGSAKADRLEVLTTLIEAYEEEHQPIPPPHPIEAIKFRMEQDGLTRADLARLMGGRSRVSEVLNGKRRLSLTMIRRLHNQLGIPASTLIREPTQQTSEKSKRQTHRKRLARISHQLSSRGE